MNVLITGSASGIGLECVRKFLSEGHTVFGIDIQPLNDSLGEYKNNYFHVFADVRNKESLPNSRYVDILINNAGAQNSEDDIDTNLKGIINTTEKYGLQPKIKSIVNMASVSAHTGAEFPRYAASKGGVLAYTKWTANEIAKYSATCNSLSFGGVLTALNEPVMKDKEKWSEIMRLTPLKKWATPQEAAEWTYFISVINKSMTGQDIIIDNGETSKTNFVW